MDVRIDCDFDHADHLKCSVVSGIVEIVAGEAESAHYGTQLGRMGPVQVSRRTESYHRSSNLVLADFLFLAVVCIR